MQKKPFIFVLMAIVLVMAAGCAPGTVTQIDIPSVSLKVSAPGPNPLANTADTNGQAAGVLLGIWHGFISPVTLVLSFANPVLQMYEVHNDGSPYNFGFLLGVAIIFVVLGVFVGSRRRR
jgi:hypothetical protein